MTRTEVASSKTIPRKPRWLFQADWMSVVFIHLQVDRNLLQPLVPFPLDLFEGDAYVSLVAFTQRNLRPCFGGRLTALLSGPLAAHEFLNVRTYVNVDGEPGIYFLAEWIPNYLASLIGPRTYGLPYRLGRLSYRHQPDIGRFSGAVSANGANLSYRAECGEDSPFTVAVDDSCDAFLLERYGAFTLHRGIVRRFRVEHAPWKHTPIRATLEQNDLLIAVAPFLPQCDPICANYSPGAENVGISWPERI